MIIELNIEIFEKNISDFIAEAISNVMDSFDDNHSYEFELLFNPKVYKTDAFWKYPINRGDKIHPVGSNLNDSESQKNFIYQVLSLQLDNAHKAIKEKGIKTKSFNICGTNEVDNTVLKITQSDDLEFGLCCCSIVPDKQNICDDSALKSFARALLPHIREFIAEQEKLKESGND